MSDKIEMNKEEFDKLTAELVSNSVKKALQDEMDNIDRKYQIHPEMSAKQKQEQLDSEQSERFVNLFKFAAKKDWSQARKTEHEIKANDGLNETTDADGGYFVPAVTKAQILRLIPTFGQARNEMSVIPMGKTDTLNIPSKLTGVSVNWVNEASSITSSHPTFSYIQLVAKKLAGLTSMSNELLMDANVDIVNYVVSLFAEAIGAEEDAQFFAGTGSPMSGVFLGTNTFGKEQFVADSDGFTYDNLKESIYGIDQNYIKGAKWYAHRTIVSKLRGILDQNDLPIFVDANAGGLPTLMGYPVKMIENCPTSAEDTAGTPLLVLGNLKNSFIGSKMDVRIAFSDSATVDADSMFQYDLSAIRLITRVAFNKGLTGAYSAISLAD